MRGVRGVAARVAGDVDVDSQLRRSQRLGVGDGGHVEDKAGTGPRVAATRHMVVWKDKHT